MPQAQRSASVVVDADISPLARGLAAGAARLGQFGAAAARMGGQLAQSIASGTSAGIASINRFASQSNASLTTFFERSDRQRENFERGWGRLSENLSRTGKSMAVGLTVPLTLLAGQSFKTYAQIDSLQRGLTAVMHSASAASREFTALRQVAALPGLGLQEAVQGSVRLQAVGFSADSARKALLEFGNAIALTGGGKAELNSVTVQLGQLAAKGKVLSQDLRPIIEAAPSIAPTLLKIFDSVDPEVISTKLAAAGKNSKYFVELLTNELSRLERITGGPKNALENLGDSVAIAQYNFGLAADKALGLSDKLNSLGNFVTGVADKFGGLSGGMQIAVLSLTAIAAITGPVLIGLGATINLVRALTVETGALSVGLNALKAGFLFLATPLGATLVAATALIGSLAILGYSVQQYGAHISTAVNENKLLAEVQAKVAEATASETTRLNSLLAVARDETVSKKARLQAVKDLNALSPQYLGNLNLETINTAAATKAVYAYANALTLKAKVQALSERAAQASIKVDDIGAKSAKEFVDHNRFSADQIAVNLKLTTSFNRESDGAKLFDELGQRRKKEALTLAQNEAKFFNEQVKKAYVEAAKSGVQLAPTTVTVPPVDFKNLGGDSSIQKLKDDVKAARDKVESFIAQNGKGAKIPIELQLELKNKSKLLKDAQDAAKSLMPATGKPKVVKQAGEFGDVESLKRLESYLESTIQRAGGKGVDEQVRQLASVRNQIELLDALTSKDKKSDILGIKEITSPATSERVSAIVDNFHAMADVLPSLFSKTDIKQFLVGLDQSRPSLEYYENKIEEIKKTIATLTLNKKMVPEELLQELDDLKRALKEAMGASEAADAKTDTGPDSMGGWVAKAEARIAAMKAAGKTVNQTAVEMAKSMKDTHDMLAQAGTQALEGFGEGIGAGINPLKAALGVVLNLLSDFMIRIGTAMVIGGTLLEAATTAFPFLKPFLGLKGIEGALAGGALIVGGGAVRGLAGNFEKGGTFNNEAIIRVAETSKATAGGGEWVAPIDKGADLVAARLMRRGGMANGNGSQSSNAPADSYMGSGMAVDIRLSGDVRQSGGDLIYAIRRAEKLNKATGAN